MQSQTEDRSRDESRDEKMQRRTRNQDQVKFMVFTNNCSTLIGHFNWFNLIQLNKPNDNKFINFVFNTTRFINDESFIILYERLFHLCWHQKATISTLVVNSCANFAFWFVDFCWFLFHLLQDDILNTAYYPVLGGHLSDHLHSISRYV